MTIEQEVFRRKKFCEEKMEGAGFVRGDGLWTLKADFMEGEFRVELFVYENGDIRGKVVDVMNDEEYAPLRMTQFGGAYVNSVRSAYTELLRDIAERCCTADLEESIPAERGAAGIKDESLVNEVLSIADSIPAGKVASYGRIAELIGRPKNARFVGKIMSMADRYGDHPCHRVVNHAGRTVPGWNEQRRMLEKEGVEFKTNGCVDMKKHQS